MTKRSVYHPNDDIITFPMQARLGAITRDDIGAIEFLQSVKLVQKRWVMAGHAHEEFNPGLHHNVSNTCVVRASEWDAVARFFWDNRHCFTGVALLGHLGDKIYRQAPQEAVATEGDMLEWNRLVYHEVDYSLMIEEADHTEHKDVAARAGGACDLVLRAGGW
jgi:ribonucleoside-diphosphate reductase alpha chain